MLQKRLDADEHSALVTRALEAALVCRQLVREADKGAEDDGARLRIYGVYR